MRYEVKIVPFSNAEKIEVYDTVTKEYYFGMRSPKGKITATTFTALRHIANAAVERGGHIE